MENEIEKCPKCGSIYIQQDRVTKRLYCLIRECGHKWDMELPDRRKVKNAYLRVSMG